MVTKAILEGQINGVGKLHKTAIFPCTIYQMKTGVNRHPGDPNYDLYQLALECTSKRLYPNYTNCDFSAQKDWIQYDKDNKQKVIDSLTQEQYQQLIQQLEKNQELQVLLSLKIVEVD